MAGLGFKDFQVGEVLTSSDVDGYLMQQTVMRFADSGARGSALGTAPGTAVALAEGMVSYLQDANTVQMYDGSGWVGIGNFSAATAITATDASWSVPTLADPVVKVTVIGGGGGGGGNSGSGPFAGNGGTTTFGSGAAFEVSAQGGFGGASAPNGGTGTTTTGNDGRDGFASGNGGTGAAERVATDRYGVGGTGNGGEVKVVYVDLSGVSTVNVVIGAGGSAGSNGGAGGDGVVIVEYRAG